MSEGKLSTMHGNRVGLPGCTLVALWKRSLRLRGSVPRGNVRPGSRQPRPARTPRRPGGSPPRQGRNPRRQVSASERPRAPDRAQVLGRPVPPVSREAERGEGQAVPVNRAMPVPVNQAVPVPVPVPLAIGVAVAAVMARLGPGRGVPWLAGFGPRGTRVLRIQARRWWRTRTWLSLS